MKMEKLELKHLAPYLPYGLKFRLSDVGLFNIDCEYAKPAEAYRTLTLNNIIFGNTPSVELIACNGWSIAYIELDEIKPILRPLSDLTNEIEVDGEKFVPLKKMSEIFNIIYEDVCYMNGEGSANIQRFFCYNKPKKYFFYRCIDDFYTQDRYSESELMCKTDQFAMMQKLFEWHFDIFNLIEKNLAIDINTLKP